MVAKMPKVNGTMKKMPYMKTLTKTTLKKKKNKIAGVPKEASLKVVKKKKMKDVKKKIITEGTVVKSVKAKLKAKTLKVKKNKTNIKTGLSSPILNEDLMSSPHAVSKEESSSDMFKTSGGFEGENILEMKPVESKASKVEFEVPAEKCVVHQLPDFSSENLKMLEKKKDKDSKINLEKKKKKGKKNIRNKKLSAKGLSALQGPHTGDSKINSGSNVQENIPLKADKLEESTAVKKGKTKKKKKIQGSKIKAQVNKKNSLKQTGDAGTKKKTKKNLKKKAKGTNMDSEQRCESLADAEDDHESRNSTSQENVEQPFEELPPLSIVIDTKKDKKGNNASSTQGSAIKYSTFDAVYFDKLRQRERELAGDLFAGVRAEEEEDEDMEESVLPSTPEEENSRKRNCDSNVPDDPFDIHEMEVSPPKKKPAWVDEDDENVKVKDAVANMVRSRGKRGIKETSEKKYESELREKFTNVIGGTPDWADLDNKPKDEDEENDLVRKTGNYLSGKSSVQLPRRTLEYKQMLDLNSSHTEGALIQAVDFNPDLQVAIVAGSLRHLGSASLFQVDGNNNHRIHSVRLPSYPVTCARFLRDGRKFVVGSEAHSHFFVYDMETSKETKLCVNKKFEKSIDKNLYVNPDGETFIYLDNRGKMFVYDTASLSLIDILESPFPLTSATFNSDGTRMYTYGKTGEVCIWDMTSRMCIHRFVDEGCIAGDAIAMSPNNQYLACGSRSGIVNIYDSSAISSREPAPVKVLSNLTTSVTALSFNASSEILALASNRKPNAVKLVHFPSMTVFENFPRLRKELKRILCASFSSHSGYLALGDNGGAATLFRLKHFSSY